MYSKENLDLNTSPPSDKYLAAWKFQSMFSQSVVLYKNLARLLEVRRFNIYFSDISLEFFVIIDLSFKKSRF